LVLDELGYLALPEGAAELVFQVISVIPPAGAGTAAEMRMPAP